MIITQNELIKTIETDEVLTVSDLKLLLSKCPDSLIVKVRVSAGYAGISSSYVDIEGGEMFFYPEGE